MFIESINPANGTLLRSYSTLTKKALTMKVNAAHEASWRFRRTTAESRAMWLRKLAGILEHEMEELASLLTSETGKTIVCTRQEILDCAACCRYFAEHAEELPSDSKVPMEMSSCEVRWQPLGVVLAIMQGSNPFWQVFRFLAPALLAGDTVLLRHADAVCQSAMEVELLVMRAGFPRDVVQTLLISDRQLGPLLSEKQLAAVAVGEQLLNGRAMVEKVKSLMRATSQERSSNAFVVMPSANLYAAIQTGVASRCMEDGAASSGATRFVVHERIYDEFELLFTAGIEDMKIGDPGKDATVVGPLASAMMVKEVEAQVAAALRDGGRLLTGGQRMVGAGSYFEPTVIADIAPGKKTRKTVFSGPVALLFKVASMEEAIEAVNESPYSLSASVWTEEADEQQDFAAQLECESVFINSAIVGDPLMAMIGDRRSRSGSDLAAAMLREMMMARTIVVADQLPQPVFEMNLALEHEPVLDAEGNQHPNQKSVQKHVQEPVSMSFADVLTASEVDATLNRLQEIEPAGLSLAEASLAVKETVGLRMVGEEANIPVGMADIFEVDEEWAPTVTLHETHALLIEEVVEESVAAKEPAVAQDLGDAAGIETVEQPVSALEAMRATVAPIAAPVQMQRATLRKTVMSGVMKQIVDQVIAKNRKVKPAIASAIRTHPVTKAKAEQIVAPKVEATAAVRTSATAAEPELCLVGAGTPQTEKAVDFQKMFEKALSNRPGG